MGDGITCGGMLNLFNVKRFRSKCPLLFLKTALLESSENHEKTSAKRIQF